MAQIGGTIGGSSDVRGGVYAPHAFIVGGQEVYRDTLTMGRYEGL